MLCERQIVITSEEGKDKVRGGGQGDILYAVNHHSTQQTIQGVNKKNIHPSNTKSNW